MPRDYPDDPPGAEYDATVFVKDITPVSGFPGIPEGYSPQDEDDFYDVVPGTDVTFDIDFYNNTVEPVDSALVFKAWIAVPGNDVALLDQRIGGGTTGGEGTHLPAPVLTLATRASTPGPSWRVPPTRPQRSEVQLHSVSCLAWWITW